MSFRYLFLVLAAFIYPKTVFSQAATPPKFQWVDRHCQCPEFRFEAGKFEIIPYADPRNEIEVRLYSGTYGSARTITILSVRNDSIQGFYYIQRQPLRNYDKPDSVKNVEVWERHPWKKFAIKGPDLKAALAEMIDHNLLRLPEQKTLMKGEAFGSKYALAFKYYDHIGSYSFDDTTELIEGHPEIPKFKDYLAILRLFHKLTADYENAGLIATDY